MLMLVFFDIVEMTVVPRLPHPMIPILMAELALVPKTIPGFKIVAADITPAFFTNILLFIFLLFKITTRDSALNRDLPHVHCPEWATSYLLADILPEI